MELESDTGGARPGIGGGGVALDLPPSAAFAGSHHLEALMPVVLVDKDIVLGARSRHGGHRITLHGGIPSTRTDTTSGKCDTAVHSIKVCGRGRPSIKFDY